MPRLTAPILLGLALVIAGATAALFGGLPLPIALLFCAAGLVVAAMSAAQPARNELLHIVAFILGGLALWLLTVRAWWGALPLIAGAGFSLWMAVRDASRSRDRAEEQREEIAAQLDRRISELFSLQELSYVLSESIQLDRIVEQVVRYAGRFLQAEGAALILLEGEGPSAGLRIAAAEGVLQRLTGEVVPLMAGALVGNALERDRIEVMQGVEVPSVDLLGGHLVRSAAVAPLRSHGVTLGALAVADRESGPFTTEDLWLLSTVATQASVVLANSRLFEMVRRSTEEWETAFNALTEGIAVVDAAGQVARCNQALAALLDRPASAVVSADFYGSLFGDGEGAVEAAELIGEALQGDRPAPRVLRSDAAGRVLRLTAAPLSGTLQNDAVVVLVEDVTEQRAMEAQLIQNEKMAAIGQLVSGVAHELNNPLTSIAGLTELLLERGPLAEAPREHVRVIHEQAERAGRIVRNLLTFARKGTPDNEPVDLNDVVSRTALLLNYDLKLRGVELETRLTTAPVTVLGDRYELQQVLLNLATNAVQALSELPAGTPRVLAIETSRQEDLVVLSVRDTGPGVPAALVPYLFTPFFTTKGPGQGTGLGLSLSYGLIESHGGRLTFQPAPEGGAEFTIVLPACSEPATMEHPAAASNGNDTGPRRILVVDEDPAVHRLISALFSTEGYEVEVSRGGRGALGLTSEADYDLIIADAGTPADSGELFVSALLRDRPEWRERLLVAAEAGVPPPAGLASDPELRWVQKPFNLRDLRSTAAEVIG